MQGDSHEHLPMKKLSTGTRDGGGPRKREGRRKADSFSHQLAKCKTETDMT